MIKEDYVSYETAKLLKEKGFNEATSHVYSDAKELLRLTDYGTRDLTNKDCDEYMNWQFPIEEVTDIISAPTIQMAMKWLRETIGITIGILFKEDRIYYEINQNNEFILGVDTPESYEKVCDEAIKYCLKFLI